MLVKQLISFVYGNFTSSSQYTQLPEYKKFSLTAISTEKETCVYILLLRLCNVTTNKAYQEMIMTVLDAQNKNANSISQPIKR